MTKKDIILDLETINLEPYFPDSRITVIGLGCNGQYGALTNPDEKIVLENFSKFLFKLNDFRIVTFNGSSFDIPFLLSRLMYYNIKCQNIIDKHIDIRKFMNLGNGFKKGTLGDFAQLVGMKKLESIDGSSPLILWNEGRMEN